MESHLGCRASFLYSQSSLSRGIDTREAHLNSLFRYDLTHIRPDDGQVLALVSFQGKTNQVCNAVYVGCIFFSKFNTNILFIYMQNGNIQYTGAMRHK